MCHTYDLSTKLSQTYCPSIWEKGEATVWNYVPFSARLLIAVFVRIKIAGSNIEKRPAITWLKMVCSANEGGRGKSCNMKDVELSCFLRT